MLFLFAKRICRRNASEATSLERKETGISSRSLLTNSAQEAIVASIATLVCAWFQGVGSEDHARLTALLDSSRSTSLPHTQ